MATGEKRLRCVVVTPERTVLDREADLLVVPLYDGELGILNGRAPLIARLGFGELRCQTAQPTERLYVDGGFVQVRDNVVSVLTEQALSVGELDVGQAQEALETALRLVPTNDEAFTAKERAMARARAQIAVAGRRTVGV